MSVQGFQIDIDLGELSNINLTGSPAALTGEVLKFDGVNWVNSPDTSGLIDVVDDLSPQLGGNLSVNGRDITAEPPASVTSNGNNVRIVSTDGGSVSGTGGDISLITGNAVSAAGDIFLTSGNSTNSDSGTVTIKTGTALNNGGDIIFELGHGTATGDVIITSSDATGSYRPGLRFLEASTNGTNYIELKGPTNATASRTWILPQNDPVAADGTFLTTNASGELDFAIPISITIDNFSDGVDYTSGTTTVLTLSVDAGSENNITVMFDGVVQHHDQYGLSGTTLTFSSAIPTGTADVEVTMGNQLSAGTPTDASVTIDKLSSTLKVFNLQFSLIVGNNNTFTILQSAGFGFTIDRAYYQTTTGTITADIRIENISVTGLSALSITTTEGNTLSTANDIVTIGDKVTIITTLDVGGSPEPNSEMVSILLECTRT